MTKQRLDQLQQLIQANQQALQEQIGQFAGQKIAENVASVRQTTPRRPISSSIGPFRALSDQGVNLLRKEVRRLANRLRSRIALRRSAPRAANWTPKRRFARSEATAACQWRSNIATTAFAPSWS